MDLNRHVLDLFSVSFHLYPQIFSKRTYNRRSQLDQTCYDLCVHCTPARYLPPPPAPVFWHLTLSPPLHMGLQPVWKGVCDWEKLPRKCPCKCSCAKVALSWTSCSQDLAFQTPWGKWYHDKSIWCLIKSMVKDSTNQWKVGWKRNTKNLWLFRRGQTRL